MNESLRKLRFAILLVAVLLLGAALTTIMPSIGLAQPGGDPPPPPNYCVSDTGGQNPCNRNCDGSPTPPLPGDKTPDERCARAYRCDAIPTGCDECVCYANPMNPDYCKCIPFSLSE